MSPKILIATCAKYPTLLEDDRFLLDELRKREVAFEIKDWWDKSVDWESADAILIRATWDYREHVAEFQAWLSRLEEARAHLINPVRVIRENFDKHYLRKLEEQGIRTLPTTWIESEGEIDAAVAALNPSGDYVVKPCVSSGAFMTERLPGGSPKWPAVLREILVHSPAMVQEFAAEIEEEGEWSFLFFGGKFSHAVVKRPGKGDFRVQWMHGGSHEGRVPGRGLLAQAEAVLKAACPPYIPKDSKPVFPNTFYARVDGIIRGGKFVVMELELFEPHLFWTECAPSPEAGARLFVDELKKRVR